MTAPGDRNFDEVFDRLKGMLEAYAPGRHVSADDDRHYGVDLAPAEERSPTTWFGAVRRGKRYVSIYLMPVYADPSLLEGASPELIRRRQGKSCFNFAAVGERLFGELESVLRRGYERTAGDRAWAPAARARPGAERGARAGAG